MGAYLLQVADLRVCGVKQSKLLCLKILVNYRGGKG